MAVIEAGGKSVAISATTIIIVYHIQIFKFIYVVTDMVQPARELFNCHSQVYTENKSLSDKICQIKLNVNAECRKRYLEVMEVLHSTRVLRRSTIH